MKNHDAPRRIREHISIQQIGTETLVYDEHRHKAFCLNQSSSVIWLLASGDNSIARIAEMASATLKAAVNEEFVLFALAELRKDGLLLPASTVEAKPAISRRALLQRLGIGGALLLPVVAAIVAPSAAQAYSGCFDCSTSQATKARKGRGSAVPPH
jgi:hypothetical protein